MAPAKTATESKRWLPLLLAAMVALAALVLWDRQAGDGEPKAAAGKPPRAESAARPEVSGNPLAGLTVEKLHDTVGRPLFERTRRPVEVPAPLPQVERAPVAPAIDQNALSLLGVVASEGRTIALIRRNQTGQSVRAEVGDTVDGWTIASIEPQRVVLRQGDRQVALQLFRRKSPP
jgi:Type II secretion system protein C